MEDDEDQDDLLQLTDDCDDYDSTSSESDEYCEVPKKLSYKKNKRILNKLQFFITMLIVNVSSILLTILLPLYLESINEISSVSILMQFTTVFTALILMIVIFIAKEIKYSTVMFYKPPEKWCTLLKISLMYTTCGFMILYAHRKVVCHIQDPIKGILLIVSLTYYFIFCKQFMRLQSIFAITTIIVGLFISVDYGLCNKFRCRGLEIQPETDTESWSLEEHVLWTLVYIGGLALFSGFYTILERYYVPEKTDSVCYNNSALLATVSCLVSSRDVIKNNSGHAMSKLMPITNKQSSIVKSFSSLHISLWLHIFVAIVLTGIFWINTLVQATQQVELSGFLCHFTIPRIFRKMDMDCGNISLYGWLFLLTYIVYIVSSIRFLIVSESAVFVVAVTVAGLPLTTIWWSLFRLDVSTPGLLIWAPTITGELICAVLGIPIIISGIIFLCKLHFQVNEVVQSPTQQSSNLLPDI